MIPQIFTCIRERVGLHALFTAFCPSTQLVSYIQLASSKCMVRRKGRSGGRASYKRWGGLEFPPPPGPPSLLTGTTTSSPPSSPPLPPLPPHNQGLHTGDCRETMWLINHSEGEGIIMCPLPCCVFDTLFDCQIFIVDQ